MEKNDIRHIFLGVHHPWFTTVVLSYLYWRRCDECCEDDNKRRPRHGARYAAAESRLHHAADVSTITTQPYFLPAPTLEADLSPPHTRIPHTDKVDVPSGGKTANYKSPRMIQLQQQQSFDYDCR